MPLTASFRWRTTEQADLASSLRNSEGAVLRQPQLDETVNVVLATRWRALWDVGSWVLPMAYGSAKGNNMEAAATVLLDRATRTIHGERATYLADALTTLGVVDPDSMREIDDDLASVVELLKTPGKPALVASYNALIDAMRIVSQRTFKAAHWRYTDRLKLLQQRLSTDHDLTPGMTVHQAKGREWDRVGLRLIDSQSATLAGGLNPGEEAHRQLYVACTRARYATLIV
jgi:DNA helicase II / ATP-dependent DNA helicase PcrA